MLEQDLHKVLTIGRYLVTPERSQETLYRPNVSQQPDVVKHIKTVLWIVLAFALAYLISRLQ